MVCAYIVGHNNFCRVIPHAIGSAGVVHSMQSDVILPFMSIRLFSAGIVS